MKVILIDSDSKYSSALMRNAAKNFKQISFNHYPSLEYVEGKHSHFPTGDANLVVVSSRALDENPDWATKVSIQEIFGSIPVIVNLEQKDSRLRSTIPVVPGELEVVSKGRETSTDKLLKRISKIGDPYGDV